MGFYKGTETLRRTLNQEARIILARQEEAPPDSYRLIQVLVPASPRCYVGVDVEIQTTFESNGIGPNRNYQVPVFPPRQQIPLVLLPHQHLTAMADTGIAFLTLIVEHHFGEGKVAQPSAPRTAGRGPTPAR